MSIFVSGSVAYDTIISTVGTFASNARGEEWSYNLSLFAPSVRIAFWGTGHNIAYNLGLLWYRNHTHLVACVGHDFDYTRYSTMIDYIHLTQDDTALTGHAYMINDDNNAQIISFHPWALWSWMLSIPNHPYSYAIIAPNDKPIMIAHLHAARQSWAIVFFDPGQQLWLFTKEDIIWLQSSIDYLICNESEGEHIAILFNTTIENLHTIFPKLIVTKGENWVKYWDNEIIWNVPVYPTEQLIDPTGAWDALRWWLLAGLMSGKSLEISLWYWVILWSLVVSHQGTMEHTITMEELQSKYRLRKGE